MRKSRNTSAAPLLLSILGGSVLLVFNTSCVKQARRAPAPPGQNATAFKARREASTARLVNINTATRDELERLPHLGTALAERIIEHRERYGRFRRPEHLLMVRGLGERRFRELRSLIVVE